MPLPVHRLTSATLVLALTSALLILAGCSRDSAPRAAAAPGPTRVGVLEVKAQPLTLRTELPGRTAPFLVAEVRPQVGGIVQARLFEEGAPVKAGQTLYRLDDATYRAELDSARAALAKAQANLAAAELRAQRYEELVGIDAVSGQARDDAQAALLQAQAEVASGRAAVRNAQIRVDYAQVSAPIAGVAGRSTVTPGALVTMNQAAALVRIQQLDPVYVDIQRPSSELLKLQRDFAEGRLQRAGADKARVKLLLEDGSAYPLEGTLQFAETSVDPATGSVTLRAVFPNPKRTLLPGMYVRALLEEGRAAEAILVPQHAVSRDPRGQATALVVGAEGKAELRTLQVDRAVGEQWLVRAGLKAGDRLIVDGLQRLRPGAPVQPVDAAASAPASASAPVVAASTAAADASR